jgi:hypothetical protein
LEVRILKDLTFVEAFWNEQFQKVLEVRILMGLQGNIFAHKTQWQVASKEWRDGKEIGGRRI